MHYEVSYAVLGNIVWFDKDYTFEHVPDFLVGAPFFRLTYLVEEHVQLKVVIKQPSVIYVFSSNTPTKNGGLDTSLPADGWKEEMYAISTTNGRLNNTWSKTFRKRGNASITLPQTTSELNGIILVQGNHTYPSKCYIG